MKPPKRPVVQATDIATAVRKALEENRKKYEQPSYGSWHSPLWHFTRVLRFEPCLRDLELPFVVEQVDRALMTLAAEEEPSEQVVDVWSHFFEQSDDGKSEFVS